jgi:hypothetical protein
MKVRYRRVMTRLVAILVTLFLAAIPAKADVTLWPRPTPGLWTVIQVWGQIQLRDLADFERYTENVNPATTLVIVTGPAAISEPASAWTYASTRKSCSLE